MFITKKNYEDALAKQKEEINREWEKMFAERDERFWRQKSEDDFREEVRRRFNAIEKRVHELEKYAGFEEDKPVCPFEVKNANY